MTDPTTLPTYGAVRAAYVRDREQQQRRHTRGIPTDAQRAQWSAEFDRWADAIRAEVWDEGALAAIEFDRNWRYAVTHGETVPAKPDNPYRKD